MSLVDKDSSLVDALGFEAFLVNTGLKSLVQELVEGKTEHVIELEFLVGEETITMHSVEEGSAFEKSSGVFLVEGEELSGGLSEFGQHQMHSPDLTLVLETVLADQLQLVVDSLLFEGSSGSLERGGVYINQQVQFL